MFSRISRRPMCHGMSLNQSRFAHTKIAIAGGGTGAMAVVSQILKRKLVENGSEITVFDPSPTHFYQPALTMVSGGVLGSAQNVRTHSNLLSRDMKSIFDPSINLIQDKVTEFDPNSNSFHTNKSGKWTYDYLVVAMGNDLRFDLIEGAEDALDDLDSPVGSMYVCLYSQ